MVELLQDSTQNFKSNMLDQYLDRPAVSFCGEKCVNQFYSVEFLRYHCLKKKKKQKKKNSENQKLENDYQPNELPDELIEENHCDRHSYSKVLPLSVPNPKYIYGYYLLVLL